MRFNDVELQSENKQAFFEDLLAHAFLLEQRTDARRSHVQSSCKIALGPAKIAKTFENNLIERHSKN